MTESPAPFGNEQAKAAQEVAKATGKAIDAAREVGAFVGRVLGTPIENAVGVLGGDWLSEVRMRNAAKMAKRTEEILASLGVTETVPVSPVIAVQLLNAAQDENRAELQELWARLMATAMNPKTTSLVRQSFITTLKQFEPIDARMLEWAIKNSAEIPDVRAHIAREFGITKYEVDISIDNLMRLQCLVSPGMARPMPSALGHELWRACR